MEQEILRMKFVFDENKLKANGMTEEDCIAAYYDVVKHNA